MKIYKWAIFSLFFCFLVIFFLILVNNVNAKIEQPISPPPDDNAAGFLQISDIDQAKTGSLRLGTNNITPPFNYQLEVLGLGADFSNVNIDKNLTVWENSTKTKQILMVDANNNRVCIGPCLNIQNSKLEVSNSGSGASEAVLINNSSGIGRALSAFSNSDEAIFGRGAVGGIQGLASGSDNYGIYAFSAAGVAIEGENTAEPKTYSSVAGVSDTGIGIFGTNSNNLGLWSAYFNGRVKSNADVGGSKFLATKPQNSLVPYTSGQEVGKYFKTYSPNRLVADNNFIWVGQTGFLVDNVWQGQEVLRLNKATGKILDEYNLGSTSGLILDTVNNFIWQSSSTYSGRIGRINTSNFIDQSRTILDADSHGTCPMSSLALDPTDSNILWVLQTGGTCFSRTYNDRLLKFEITGVNGYTVDPTNWEPLARYEIFHSEGSPQTPTAIVSDDTNLWLSFQDNDKVYKINPADPGAGDNDIYPTDYTSYAVPGPTDLVYDSVRGYIWASANDDNSSNNGAYHINISTGVVSNQIVTNTGPVGPMSLAYDGSNIWVGTTNSSSTGYVDKIDPDTDTVVGQYSTGTNRTVDVIVDSGVIWTANWYDKELARLSAIDGRQLDVYSYGNTSLAVKYFDGTYLWITKNGELLKVRASDGFQILETNASINATEVIDDGNYIWAVVDDGTDATAGDKISKINSVTGVEECSLAVPNPASMAFNGFQYWVVSNDVANNQGNLLKINMSDCTQIGGPINLTVLSDFTLGKMIFDGNYLWILATEDTETGAVINVNPSSGEAMMWEGLVGNKPADIYFDNYYYWVSSAGHQILNRFYLRENDKLCSQLDTNSNYVSCTNDSECGAVGGTCIFNLPQQYGEYVVSNDSTHITNNPSDLISDGNYLWINNIWVDSSNNSHYELVKMSMADPNQIKGYNLNLTPTGLVYDGTYLWVSSSTGILDKINSGTGYGSTDLSGTLALQNNNILVPQSGSLDIQGSGQFGDSTTGITATGDLVSLNNVWGEGLFYFNNENIITWSASGSGGSSGSGTLTGAYLIQSLLSASDGSFYAGVSTSAGGRVYRSPSAGSDWEVTIGPYDGNPIYSLMEDSDGNIYAGSGSISNIGYVSKTVDQGNNWNRIMNISGIGNVYSLIQLSNGDILAGSGTGTWVGYIYRLPNGSSTWVDVGFPIDRGQVTSLLLANNGDIFAGTTDPTASYIYKSNDNGVTWVEKNIDPNIDGVKDLLQDNANFDIFYAAVDAAVTEGEVIYKSIDGGENWLLAGSLGNALIANSIVQLVDGTLDAVTTSGSGSENVYQSLDQGNSWAGMGNISGATSVLDIVVVDTNEVYIGLGTGEVTGSGFGALEAGTYSCPNGQFITNIEKDADDKITYIECRPL